MVQLAVRGPALQLPPDALQLRPAHAGQPLSREVRLKMEALFRSDFLDVRVHVGPEAPAVGAIAFTHGSQLYFAPGQYAPGTAAGQRLLAHELTHVLQQKAGRVRNPFGSGIAVVQDAGLEAEAERMTILLDRLPTPGPTAAPRLPAPPLRPPALQQSPRPQPPPRLAAPPVRLPPPPLARPGMPAPPVSRPVATHVTAAVSSIQPKYAPAALRRPAPGLGLALQCAEAGYLSKKGITTPELALAYIYDQKPGWQNIETMWNTVHSSNPIHATALTHEVEEPKEKKKRKRKVEKKVESSGEDGGEVQEKDQHKKRKKRGSAARQKVPKTGYNWDHIFTHTVEDESGKKTHGVFYKEGKELQDLVEAAKLIIQSGTGNFKRVQRDGPPAYKVLMDENVGYFPGKGGKKAKVTRVIRLFMTAPDFVEDAYPEPSF